MSCIPPCIGKPPFMNWPGPGFIIPRLDAICAMSAIWFIIISCSNIEFAAGGIPPNCAMAAKSMPFGMKPPASILGSGELFVMLSIRAWISSREKPPEFRMPAPGGGAGPPTRSNKLRDPCPCWPSRSIARGPMGTSVRRDLLGP